jgi:tetratricopeptide (TPR) repeat protein
MGEVYRADDLKLGQPVALKFLPRRLERDEGLLERFLNEVRTARQVAHPNVCRVYDVGEVDGQHFLSMEYVDGEDLASLLRRIVRVPRDTALRFARQLCAGLAAVHAQGILHRDLKPANVMIDGKGRPKIADFGLATLAEDKEDDDVRVGTPAYMAPEQLAGAQPTTRTDVYALGLLLFELFTGKPAFEGEATSVARRRTDSTPSKPTRLVENLDPAIERVILRCLEREPADRFESAEDLQLALDRIGTPRRRIPYPRTLAAVATAALALASLAGWLWLRGPAKSGAPPGDALAVVVAPFSTVGGGPDDRGAVIQELIEQRIRGKSDAAFLRLVEGVLRTPVESEESARTAGERLGADAVCWGTVLGLGDESEIEARITLVRPIEERAASILGADLLAAPESVRQFTQSMPIGGPSQLALLKSQANQIADLATTLSGLALLKAGEYERAAWTLGQIESPTADQRFYLALAHFRHGNTAEAGRILTEVLEEHPRHVGARLAMLMIRSEDPLWSTPDAQLIADLESELTSEPTDSNFARLWMLSIAMRYTDSDTEAIVGFLRLVDRFCKDERFEGLPEEDRRMLVPIVLIMGAGSEDPRVEQAMRRLLTNEALDRVLAAQPGMDEFMCAGGYPSPRCDGWSPHPYQTDPLTYGWFHMDRGDASLVEPEALLSVASGDPRLQDNVADWLIMAHEMPPDALLEWSGKYRATGKELGRQYLVEGICLHRAGEFERAEEAYARAFEILEHTWSVELFRGTNLMAVGRFDEAIEVLETTESHQLALALAATGRLHEAYRLLARQEVPDTAGEPEPQAEDLEDSGPAPEEMISLLVGLVRGADSGHLAAVMVSMSREIEQAESVLGAVGRRLRREVAEASDLSEGIAINRGWRFVPDEEMHWVTSWAPELPYALPRDPLELLAFLEALPQSESGTDQPVAREEVAALIRHLSVVLRDEIERLDPTSSER